MELSSEERPKTRAAIKAKLEELGSYVDEELPDYIMILVANNKTKEQMNDDLSLFLRDHTSKFIEWLHGHIYRVRHPKESLNASQQTPAPKPTAIVATAGVETATSSKTVGDGRGARRSAAPVVGGEAGPDESDRAKGRPVDPSRAAAAAGRTTTDDVVSSSRKQTKRKLPSASDEPLQLLSTSGGSGSGPRASKVGRTEEPSAAAEQRQKQGRSTSGGSSVTVSALEELTVKVEQDDEFAAELDGDIAGQSSLDAADDDGSAPSSIIHQASRGVRGATSSLSAHVAKATTALSSRSQCSPVGRNQLMAANQPPPVPAVRSKSTKVDVDADAADKAEEPRRGTSASVRPTSSENVRGAANSRNSPPVSTSSGTDVHMRGGERRRLPTSSVVGSIVRKNDSESDDEYDPRRPVVGSVASVVKVTERRSSVPLSMQANSALLFKAVKAAQVSVTAQRPSRVVREDTAVMAAAKSSGDSSRVVGPRAPGKRPSSSVQERLGKRSRIAEVPSSAAAVSAGPVAEGRQPSAGLSCTDAVKPRRARVALPASAESPADVSLSPTLAVAADDPAPSAALIRAPRGASTPSTVTRTAGRTGTAVSKAATDALGDVATVRLLRRADEEAAVSAIDRQPESGTDLDLIVGTEELEELEAQPDDADAKAASPSEPATAAVRLRKPLSRMPAARQQIQGVLKKAASTANTRVVQPRARSPRFIVTLDGMSEEALTRHINVRSLDESSDGGSRSQDRGLTRRSYFARDRDDRIEVDSDGDLLGEAVPVASSDSLQRLPSRRLPAKMRLSARPTEAGSQVRLPVSQRIAVRPPVSQRIAIRPPEPTPQGGGAPKQQWQSAVAIGDASEDRGEEAAAGGASSDGMQTRERCRYWPSCKAGDACLYHHPSTPCRAFPDCTYGSQCHFIHPVCKFDALCTRDDCPYLHVAKRAVSAAAAVPLPAAAAAAAAIAAAALGSGTTGLHAAAFSKRGLLAAGLQHAARPPVTPVGPPVCKFYPRCTNMNCQFTHPKPCRYGVGCMHKATCPFSHPALPAKNQLRWSATSPSDDMAVLEALSS